MHGFPDAFSDAPAMNIRASFLLASFLLMPSVACGWPASVSAVHDGDTVQVRGLRDGVARSVRVYGVDCPELRQPFGPEARAVTETLLRGRVVQVIPTASRRSYRREVAGVVLLDDMIVLQDALVSAGLAWVDNRFCRLAVCDLWRQHQADARMARRGLWAAENPVPPWQWRKIRRHARAGTRGTAATGETPQKRKRNR